MSLLQKLDQITARYAELQASLSGGNLQKFIVGREIALQLAVFWCVPAEFDSMNQVNPDTCSVKMPYVVPKTVRSAKSSKS